MHSVVYLHFLSICYQTQAAVVFSIAWATYDAYFARGVTLSVTGMRSGQAMVYFYFPDCLFVHLSYTELFQMILGSMEGELCN